MTSQHSFNIRALLLVLLLAVGPLKAHAVFACEMMEEVVHDTCCCDHQESGAPRACDDSNCDGMLADREEPCCEHTAALGIDAEARHSLPTAKPSDLRLDLDPPDPVVAACDIGIISETEAPRPAMQFPDGVPHTSGNDTWLLTRRLRI